ncbi:LysR family transcriptional regulator [Oscillibacter valericigenes]|uniref:LysR family transcriptional regulator n=1 Tax=Oscillibacter valericigenes TaxID=351091 RepID=UPI001F28866E|nr:LysR family transcriptional regulator [Oscillibacter valericigenes]MCF2665185.1 LysR family transcriptional regulator [Oscillibacter valericigenes]
MVFRNHEYFVAIVEAGSLTKAAEQLYISQPSLSQYLKRLEASLGVELFDRSTSPLRLTYTGERYYQYVLQLMKLDENVRKEFQDIKNQVSGRLRLGVALWRGACLLPDVFPFFHQQYPDIHIELLEGRSVQLESALMNDKIDLAVMNLPRTLDYGKLTCEIICEERILIAAPTNHPYVQSFLNNCEFLGSHPIATLELLKHVPLILTKPGQNLTHEVMHALGKAHIDPDILLETGNLTTAINLVAKGIACAFVPEEGAKVCQHPGFVTYFAVDSSDLVWDLAAVYRKDAYLTHLSQLFIDTMKLQLRGK